MKNYRVTVNGVVYDVVVEEVNGAAVPYVAPVAAAPVQSTYAPAPTEAPVVQSGETAVLAEVEAPVEAAEAEVEVPAEVADPEN